MTKTYLINAWCIRPFIAVIDIEAETPQEAIAIARRRQDQLLDTAEECNSRYPWDDFAAYDDNGNELLHTVDEEARVRDAAPDLLVACQMVVDRWERGDLAEAARRCSAVIAKIRSA